MGIPASADYAAGGSFTSTCGTSECGSAFIAAGEVTAICRREAPGGASEAGAGIPMLSASGLI